MDERLAFLLFELFFHCRWEFPADTDAIGVNDQYMFGPSLLIAPVTTQGATSRMVYFPKGAKWLNFWDTKSMPIVGGHSLQVAAPIDIIPVYNRVSI